MSHKGKSGMRISFNGLMVGLLLALSLGMGQAMAEEAMVVDIAKTVVKMPLEDGISPEDAVESMKLRANMLNIKLVAELPLSKQIKAMGKEARRMEIYQFCDPLTAKKMVEYDINFAAYLPCRIALVEDAKGQNWLVMMNLDMLIQNPDFDPKLKKEAMKVRNTLQSIMEAGAAGEL
jgi:uncharacterized protein (DUF302 family)